MNPHDMIKAEGLEFPEWKENLGAIAQILENDSCLAMIYIDASGISKIEAYYGKNVYEDVLNRLKQSIVGLRGKQIRASDIVTSNFKKGSLFFIFLSQKRKPQSFHSNDFELISQRIFDQINEDMMSTLDPLIRERLRIYVGYSIALRNPLIGTERIVTRMIEDAKQMAQYQSYMHSSHNKGKLQEIILKETIHTVFQPIVDLNRLTVIGYEALTRGPEGTILESPLMLFDVARESGLLFELDRLCRKAALENCDHLEKDQKLFINLLPMTIQDPEFRGRLLKDLLQTKSISPKNIVFEVSENQAIENFAIFKDESARYTEMGFSIAIDDAGTGYSNFKSLVELHTQYIKLDISLIKGLHASEIKQQIVRSMVGISHTIDAILIAEGIETVEDLKALIALDIPYGQGFLFARPAFPFPKIHIPKL